MVQKLNYSRESLSHMALSIIEQLALWAPPILMLLITIGYYVYWGKEADEKQDTTNYSSSGGDR